MSDASMLEAGRQIELYRGYVDLVDLIARSVAAYEGTSPLHSIEIERAADRIVGQWDRSRLGRVFINLLSNAIKYSPAGGTVQIRIYQETIDDESWATVAISDQGIGIPGGDVTHIFNRRRRGRNVGVIKGNGLGLAGAAEVIRLHGGTITVTSEEGVGSTFTVRLPLTLER